jgi:hypothetical protein
VVERRIRLRRLTPIILLAVFVLFVAGCSSAEIEYEPEGGTYTAATVGELAATIDDPSFAGAPSEEAEELRHEQLAALRAEGGSAALLADILTEEFPTTTAAVPYYAEEAVVDDREAWVVLEVWGSPGANLDRQRLWVLERESGEIILSMVFN